jgi:hypothetical protein
VKRAFVVLGIGALSGLAYLALTSALAGRDVFAAVLRAELGALLLVVLVLGLRLFLILALPGWLLWLVVGWLERRAYAFSERAKRIPE